MSKFKKDVIFTFITKAILLIFSLFITIVIARALKPEGNGVYSLAILLPSLLITFSNVGIGQASVFYIGKKKYPLKDIFGNNIILSLLISTFAISIGLLIIFFFSNYLFSGVRKEYLFLALMLIPFQFFLSFIVCILLGLQKIKNYNLINLFQVFVFLILIGIFLLGFRLGIKAVISAQILSLFVGGIVAFFWTIKETDGISFEIKKPYLKNSFLYGSKAYLADIFSFLNYRINIFLINFFINPAAVGFYSVATAMTEKLWLISNSVSIVLFPRVASETNEKNLKEFTSFVCRNVLLITTIGAILLFLVSRWIIILLFSEAYLNSIQPFNILLIGAIAISGWNILANDLMGRGRPIINTYLSAGSLVLNIILNIFLIPRFGIIGAAWAMTISYTILFLSTAVIYSKISGNGLSDILFLKKSDLDVFRNLVSGLFKNKINYN